MDFEEIEAQFMALGDEDNEAESIIGESVSTPAATYHSFTHEELEELHPQIMDLQLQGGLETIRRSYSEEALNQEINDIPIRIEVNPVDISQQPFTPIIDFDGFITNITPENPVSCSIIDSGECYTSHLRAVEYGCLNYNRRSPVEGANYMITNSVPRINEGYGCKGYVIKDEAGVYYLIGFNGVVIQSKFTTEIKVIDETKISVNEMFHKLINTFVEHYGEEFVSYPTIDEIEIAELLTIIVKYPEITVTNSVKESTVIRDFYVKYDFRFLLYTDELCLIRLQLSGIRGLYTLDEFLAGYSFSHLSGDVENWGSFCFGESQINTIYNRFKDDSLTFLESDSNTFDKFIDDIELFIFNMDSYLTWESISTAPYKYMSSIGKKNRFNDREYTDYLRTEYIKIARGVIASIFSNDKLRNRLIDECFISTDDLFSVDIYRMGLFIDNLFKESKRSTTYKVFRSFKYDPITFEVNGRVSFTSMEWRLSPDGTSLNSPLIIFKGKEVLQKVLDYKVEEINKKDDLLIINPIFIAACILVINELFINIKYDGTIFKPATTSS